MNFNTIFNIIKESPDNIAPYYQRTATAFIISPKFSIISLVPDMTHGDLLNFMIEFFQRTKKNVFSDYIDKYTKDIVLNGDFSSIRSFFEQSDSDDRSHILKYSSANKLNILVGRLWSSKKIISFWNYINDVSQEAINAVADIIWYVKQIDLSVYSWEIYIKENNSPVEKMYSLDELEKLISNEFENEEEDYSQFSNTTPINMNDKWDELHVMNPAIKGQFMKQRGIMPKTAMGIQKRFAMGESENNFDKLYQLVKEDEIGDVVHVGDWSPGAKPRGWDKPSIGILTSDSGITKLRRKWENCPYKFDVYFVRQPNAKNYLEIGEVKYEFIRDKLNYNFSQDRDAITIFYTNNIGANRIPATPWTLAHRAGHAMRRSYYYKKFTKSVNAMIRDIGKDVYGFDDNRTRASFSDEYSFGFSKKTRALCNALGTMKSARDRKILNEGEFAHELVAQFITTGKITFNRNFPKILPHRGFRWGQPDGSYIRRDINLEELEDKLAYWEERIYHEIDSVIDSNIGSIFVM